MIFTVVECKVIIPLGTNNPNYAYIMLMSEVAVAIQERDVEFISSSLK